MANVENGYLLLAPILTRAVSGAHCPPQPFGTALFTLDLAISRKTIPEILIKLIDWPDAITTSGWRVMTATLNVPDNINGLNEQKSI